MDHQEGKKKLGCIQVGKSTQSIKSDGHSYLQKCAREKKKGSGSQMVLKRQTDT